MRAGLIVTLVLAMSLLVAEATKRPGYIHFVKQRTRPREIRGFKPDTMQTAIGFGKRDDTMEISKLNRRDRILTSLLRNFPRGIPYEWILREIEASPQLAERLTKMLLDQENGQQNLMSDYYVNPDATVSII